MWFVFYIISVLSEVSPGFLVGSEEPKCRAAIQSWSIFAFREPGWEVVGRRRALYSRLFLFNGGFVL